MIRVGTLTISIPAVYVIYAILQTLEKKSGNTNPKKDFAAKLLCCVTASIVTVCLAQCMIVTKALCMGFLNFFFGVTMQNHGDYYYKKEDFTNSISLNDYDDYFDVEQYLSLIHETDKAIEHLVTYFEGVVIVFFGDHQPHLNESFYDAIGSTTDTLDEQQKRYMVPFFIWANYDIEEKQVDCTSLNYLSSYVYEAAGIALPPYNQFLREMEGVIPSINANGFYSVDDGCYLPIDEANDEALAYLELYEALQYNNIFDKKNRNEALFPVVNP